MPKKVIKNVEHIKRNFEASTTHRKRYDADRFRCEIFKFDRTNEWMIKAGGMELEVTDGNKMFSHSVGAEFLVNNKGYEHLRVKEEGEETVDVEDTPMKVVKKFDCKQGTYRIDFIYRGFEIEEVTPKIDIFLDGEALNYSGDLFNNEFMFSKVVNYVELSEGSHTLEYQTNCCVKVFALTIREYQTYTGSRDTRDDLIINKASVTLTETVKADELEIEILYFKELKEDDSLPTDKRNKSGYIFEFRDEVNFYITDVKGTEKQVFGGYISSISVDDDLTKMTLNCGGRLIDGDKRLMMSQLQLLGGENEDLEYDTYTAMHPQFNTRGDILNYIAKSFEMPLITSNIDDNADFTQNFVHKFDYAEEPANSPNWRRVENDGWSVHYDNMYEEVMSDHLLLRNGFKTDTNDTMRDNNNNTQQFVLMENHEIKISPNEEDGGASNFWIEYGLGEPKYEVTIGGDSGGISAGSYGLASEIEKQLADTITSATGYAAVQPIHEYLANHLSYGGGYSNHQRDVDNIASDIINGGISSPVNCADRTVLLADLLSYKGVPNIYYEHSTWGVGHYWVQIKGYNGVEGNNVDLDPAPSRTSMGSVWQNRTGDREHPYPPSGGKYDYP